MKFHEILNEIIDAHSVRSVDICEKLSLKKAYISRIRSGSLVPPDFDIIGKIAGMLNVSADEYSRLAYAYQEEKTDKKYSEELSAFNQLYAFDPSARLDLPANDDKLPKLRNGQAVSGIEDIKYAIRRIISDADGNVQFFCCPDSIEFTDFIAACIRSVVLSFEWLIPFEKTTKSSDINMKIFVDLLPIIFTENAVLKAAHTDIHGLLDLTPYPYYIANDHELLIFGQSTDYGLYINSQETVCLYRERFSRSFSASKQFAVMKNNIIDFLSSYNSVMDFNNNSAGSEMYIIENNPCILFDVDLHDVLEYIADLEDAQALAMSYMEFLQSGLNNIDVTYSLFSEKGLDEIINADEYYELTAYLTKSLSKSFRRNSLKKVIEYSSTENSFMPLVIRLPIFDKTSVRAINIWSDGKMIIYYNNGTGFDILMLNEKSIVSSFIDYYKTLMKCGLIKSKDESIKDIKTALENAVES